ncbi:hypothetical protein CAPTEDRAFT_20690 [Capitella teleta]|uniref:palmitoyl-protein hydrolase n=1 Tax=Capitella teleta TaxID=283909 RepID=R7TQ96_CAPTE|nr:hypothetical protein CAPTEDRAFT_20690 [Capitella teleta]|eukprot:ELT93210.1 hypothetical protein CAPTEDRAFT_20690 [Capitella teleta]
MAAQPVVVNATAKHTASVIFLHGLGDTGHGWSQAFSMMKRPYIKYICPTANVMPVSLNAGFRMPSWFDIKGLDPMAEQDEKGINEASDIVQSLISEEESKGISRDRIVIGGFSQGGAVALYSAFTVPKPPLAGIMGLSTWMPMHQKFPDVVKSNQATPMLQCHGKSDPLVNYGFGELTSKLIKSFNSKADFLSYADLGHSSCPEEMKDVQVFLDKVLPPV